jgi:hypothetical protein
MQGHRTDIVVCSSCSTEKFMPSKYRHARLMCKKSKAAYVGESKAAYAGLQYGDVQSALPQNHMMQDCPYMSSHQLKSLIWAALFYLPSAYAADHAMMVAPKRCAPGSGVLHDRSLVLSCWHMQVVSRLCAACIPAYRAANRVCKHSRLHMQG